MIYERIVTVVAHILVETGIIWFQKLADKRCILLFILRIIAA